MSEFKNCSYCGEEIRLQAKKCKHCGEWVVSELKDLDLNEDTSSQNIITNNPKDSEDIEDEPKGVKRVLYTFFIGIFAFLAVFIWPIIIGLIAFFTVPDYNHHITNIENEVVELSKSKTNDILALFSGMKAESNMLVDWAFNNENVSSNIKEKFNQGNSIGYSKSWFWSRAKIMNKNNPEGSNVSFGFFGMVFTSLSVSDIDFMSNDWFKPEKAKIVNENNEIEFSEEKFDNLKSNKIDAVQYNDLGTKEYSNKNYDDAIYYYHKAIELDNTFALAYGNLGLAYHKIGKTDISIEYSERAIELAPNNSIRAASYYNIAKVYEGRADYYNAKKYYQKAFDNVNNPAYSNGIDRMNEYLF